MKSRTITMATLAIAVCLGSAHTVRGDLLAYEGFDVTAADLDGQATSPGGTLFSGTESWNVIEDSGVDGWEGQTTGLSYPGLQVSNGNARGWRGPGTTFNDTAGADAILAASSPTSSTTYTELYFSALINADNLQDANNFVVAWDHQTSSASGGQRLFGFEIRGSGDVYSFANGGLGGDISGPSVEQNNDTNLDLLAGTNLIVVRVTEKTSGGNDEYDLWLNPTVGSPLPAADFSETPGSFFGLVVNNGGFGFDGFAMAEVLDNSSVGSSSSQSALVDELRLGETFTDVAPIPEPASLALLGLGALALLRRRQRA